MYEYDDNDSDDHTRNDEFLFVGAIDTEKKEHDKWTADVTVTGYVNLLWDNKDNFIFGS